jgi:hypothetical protein
MVLTVALGAAALVGLGWTAHRRVPLHRHLMHKTSARWLALPGNAATDVDGDGFGLVVWPPDWAPFDGARHPWAVDQPGNGIDENGVGGDLDAPGDFSAERFDPVRFVRRPDVLIVVLETFPARNLDAEVDGRPATPFLRGLRAAGAVTGPAYTHSAFTVPSLTHLFTGSLTGAGKTSLFDDFAANGYGTAAFSGQDESFGAVAQATGAERADTFVDARHDIAGGRRRLGRPDLRDRPRVQAVPP